MSLEERIQCFETLGRHLDSMSSQSRDELAVAAGNENPWFTNQSIDLALKNLGPLLNKEALEKWTAGYEIKNPSRRVVVIAAGNIPLVGFHDFLCVLIAGHKVILKLSSKDSVLIKKIIGILVQIDDRFNEKISATNDRLREFDAVIATGSDNSSRYFEYYFGKYPHIIRKNRTSCSIIRGDETKEDLKLLGADVFDYYGLGCRNVSKIFLPRGYDPSDILKEWNMFQRVIDHHKYANNYDYQKSILLVNREKFLDAGFILLKEDEGIVSPIAMLYYEYYDPGSLQSSLASNSSKLQCIVGKHELCDISFGESQVPKLWDYADNVDTLKFLAKLS